MKNTLRVMSGIMETVTENARLPLESVTKFDAEHCPFV
jgi:hypothetical protein